MSFDTRPAPLDADSPAGREAWAPFRVDHPGELAGLLRQLRDAAAPIVLSAPGGAALVASLWSIDLEQRRINFSAEPGDPMLQPLIDADEAVAVGYLENVKLQFDLQDLLLVRGAKTCTLQARCPREIYRFQRRSAYRVRTLDRYTPTARLRHPAIADMRLTLRVIDVSVGGCALQVPADVPAIEPGLTLQGVQIELDAETRFTATLAILHVSDLGGHGPRAGCEWQALPPESQRALQRYIDNTQKRRRLLSLG
ncbi:MAG: flagellar brake protein [Proteobacteria bacterium]|nr:flagellar brake protein [Pseudomonadota bacterium]